MEKDRCYVGSARHFLHNIEKDDFLSATTDSVIDLRDAATAGNFQVKDRAADPRRYILIERRATTLIIKDIRRFSAGFCAAGNGDPRGTGTSTPSAENASGRGLEPADGEQTDLVLGHRLRRLRLRQHEKEGLRLAAALNSALR